MKKNKFIVILIMSSFIISCLKDPNPLFPPQGCATVTKKPSVSMETLLSYPEEIEINSKKIFLHAIVEASIFKPGEGCIMGYFDIASLGLPPDYKYKKIWIINDNRKEVWENSEFTTKPDGITTFYAGPNWQVGENFYAIINVSNGTNSYFIKSKKSFIGGGESV